MFPLLVMELLGDFHGLPGLYIAAVFAAALRSAGNVTERFFFCDHIDIRARYATFNAKLSHPPTCMSSRVVRMAVNEYPNCCSSVSSGVNSLAAVVLEDFIRPLHRSFSNAEALDETTATWISRFLCKKPIFCHFLFGQGCFIFTYLDISM